ncbi:tripartite tricarboxylate transporter TctB family protein [Nesterenkonia natronophila]|uniref:Tripartite tricarboxylate transporter TctB family protein n=1 Tax=Nesterenkonia natronophila TaxID=2174932 RepID=A0A3A4FI36_9MICC|nr:tripartite tricarboxylate transporter TctB family protein [Nesterenkonia natronophila]RJN31975.1 tripartite tricarboxylate transporter TctB family protein [Nesterenkonia natronophila]
MTTTPSNKVSTQDRLFAGVVVLLALVAYWQTLKFSAGYGLGSVNEPETYPRLLIFGLVALGILVALRPRRGVDEDEPRGVRAMLETVRERHAKPALVVALFVVYLLLLEPLGFVYASIFFLLSCQVVLMQKRSPKALLIVSVISVGLPFALEYIFTDVLRIFLP